jgi:hypothetical protein
MKQNDFFSRFGQLEDFTTNLEASDIWEMKNAFLGDQRRVGKRKGLQ